MVIFELILIASLFSPLHAEEDYACKAEHGNLIGTRWSWYMVEGKRCWFQGAPNSKPRSKMYWPSTRASAPEPEPDVELAPARIDDPVPVKWIMEYRWSIEDKGE